MSGARLVPDGSVNSVGCMSKPRQPKHDKQLSRYGRRDRVNGPVRKRLARHVIQPTHFLLCQACSLILPFYHVRRSKNKQNRSNKACQVAQRADTKLVTSMWHPESHCSKETATFTWLAHHRIIICSNKRTKVYVSHSRRSCRHSARSVKFDFAERG